MQVDRFVSRGHFVHPEWIDAYDHMNMARYVALFDDVTYALLDEVRLGLAYTTETRHGLFIVDARIRFRKELRVGTPLVVTLQLVGHDHVRLHMWLEMYREDSRALCATQEQIGLHASLDARKTVPFNDTQSARLAEAIARHRRTAPLEALSMTCKG